MAAPRFGPAPSSHSSMTIRVPSACRYRRGARSRTGQKATGLAGTLPMSRRARLGADGAPPHRDELFATLAECLRDLRSEEHTSELQSPCNLVCRLLLEKKK